MNKIKSIILVFLFLFLSFFDLKAQDAMFSQYYSAPLYLAPSFAGSTDGSRVVLNYRNQWPSVQTAYNVYSFSYDHYFAGYKSGVGIYMLRDVAGSGNLSKTNVGLQYSYKVRLTREWFLIPAIQFQVSQLSIDFDKLVFYEQLTFNGVIPQNSETNTVNGVKYLDVAASVIGFNKNQWYGISIDHFNKPNESLKNSIGTVPVRTKFFGGKKFYTDNRSSKYNRESFSASFIFQKQESFMQLDIGGYWSKMPIALGLWYRGIPVNNKKNTGYYNNDAISLLLGYHFQDLRIGYSYDLTISRLVGHTWGSHEISIILEFLQDKMPKRVRKRAIIPCPKF